LSPRKLKAGRRSSHLEGPCHVQGAFVSVDSRQPGRRKQWLDVRSDAAPPLIEILLARRKLLVFEDAWKHKNVSESSKRTLDQMVGDWRQNSIIQHKVLLGAHCELVAFTPNAVAHESLLKMPSLRSIDIMPSESLTGMKVFLKESSRPQLVGDLCTAKREGTQRGKTEKGMLV
jgi:hypothetical protein